MKTFNETKYSYLGTFEGSHVFQNVKFAAEKVMIDRAQYNLKTGEIVYYDELPNNNSTIKIELLRKR